MGACATKPKVDSTAAPAPLPEKDVVVKKEIEGAVENAETQPELVKEVACATEKKDDISESKKTPAEVVKSELSVETTSTPTVDAAAAAAAEVKAEKATEVEAATDVEVEKEIEVTPAEEQAKDVETQKPATDVVDEKKSVEAEKCEPKTEEKAVTETQ